MKNYEEAKKYLLSFPDTKEEFPFDEKTAVYKIIDQENPDESKMFAVLNVKSNPLQISLRCDPLLAKKLRQDYETVSAGVNLNKRYWNTIICTGQLSDDEIKSLAVLSYNLTKDGKTNR